MPRILDILTSTVETLVMPPFFAAVRILASALKKRIPKNPVAVAVPTFEPIGFDVAAAGIVREHDERNAIIDNAIAATINLIFIKNPLN